MQEKRITCIVCPRGCEITVIGEGKEIHSIQGQQCRRGEDYAGEEFICPSRILTSTVLVHNEGRKILMPVRSNRPIPREQMRPCMEEIKKAQVQGEIHRYDVLIPNICQTGADMIAAADMDWM